VLKVSADRVRAANRAVLAAAGDVTDPPPPPPGTPGLTGVGAWPFDETSGGTTPDTYQGSLVDYWAGALDGVHVYDRALSATEVAQLS
jgi:hypothetical protein